MADVVSVLGRVVREQRRAQNLTQEDLGELAGIHRTYVGMIERGEKNLTLSNLVKVSQALNITASELLRLTEEQM